MSRRDVLLGGLGLAGAGTLLLLGPAPEAQAAPANGGPKTWTARRSANGWPVLATPAALLVEGADVVIDTAPEAPAVILSHVVRRFNYEIDVLAAGEVSGWTAERTVREDYESNYLSGTAIAIRLGSYPLGVTGGFYANQLVVIRDILAECDGVVRWGGDEKTPTESHFQLDVPPSDRRVGVLANRISGWVATPGKGAGSIDPFLKSRRDAARAMEKRQATD